MTKEQFTRFVNQFNIYKSEIDDLFERGMNFYDSTLNAAVETMFDTFMEATLIEEEKIDLFSLLYFERDITDPEALWEEINPEFESCSQQKVLST